MKRKILVLFGVLLIGLVLAFFAFQAKIASAKDITLKDILFPQNRQNVVVSQIDSATSTPQTGPTATTFPEGMVNPPTQESNWVTNSPEQMEKNAAVVESVSKLIEKTAIIYATAGWVHTTTKTESPVSRSDTLPDGSPIPTAWSTDTWLLLDENGYVIRGVTIQDTGSPTTSQVTTFKDGIWTNLTLGFTTDTGNPEENKPYHPRDYVLEQALIWKDLVALEIKDTVIGKDSVTEFTIIERNLKPHEIGKPGYLVMGTVLKYYLSTETGSVTMMEQYDITPEGQHKLIQRITTIVEEKVEEPPAKVLMYLE